ncbi:MAG: O-antigen ligase family protein [Chloroflexi bacterium]|nr:O-antigen ligase family protein [Chloroflexota bacterium]
MVYILALLAFLVPIVIVTPLHDAVVLPKLATTAALTGGALLWAAVLFASDRWQPRRWPISLWIALAAFVAVNVLALAFAVDWRASLMGESQRYQGLATTGLYLLLFAATAMAVRSTGDLRWILLGLFAGGFGAAVYALIQKADLDWVNWTGRSVERPFGTLGQANVLGAFLVVAISVTIYLALTAKERWQQAGFAAGITVMLFALLFTVSRSAYLAMGLVALIWGVAALVWFLPALESTWRRIGATLSGSSGATRQQRRRRRQRKEAAAEQPGAGGRPTVLWAGIGVFTTGPLIIALLVVFFVGLPQGRVAIFSDRNSEPLDARLSLWSMSVDMLSDEPLLGHGQDSFGILFAEYRDQPDLAGITTKSFSPESSHNFFLDLASGTGLLGLGAFLAFAGAVLWHSGRRAFATDDITLRLAFVGLGAGVLGYMAAIFFGFAEAMTTWALWLLLGAMAGLLARPSPASEEPPPEEMDARPAGGTLATAFSAVALTLLGAALLGWAATLTAADLAASQARAAVLRGDHATAIRLFDRAVTLNPIQKSYMQDEGVAYQRQARFVPLDERAAVLRQAVGVLETAVSRFTPEFGDYLSSDVLVPDRRLVGIAAAKIELAEIEGTPIEDALPFVERALQLDPFQRALRQRIVELYAALGFEDLAQEQRMIIFCWSGACD